MTDDSVSRFQNILVSLCHPISFLESSTMHRTENILTRIPEDTLVFFSLPEPIAIDWPLFSVNFHQVTEPQQPTWLSLMYDGFLYFHDVISSMVKCRF